jgi:hypothetical protein
MTGDLHDTIGPHQPGTAWVTRTHGYPANVICGLTHGRVNHAGVIIRADGTSISMAPDGWRFWHGAARQHPLPDACLLITPRNDDGTPLRPAQWSTIVHYMQAQHDAGTGYNVLGLGAIAAEQNGLGRLPGVDYELGNTSNLFCSQAVDAAWETAGIHAFSEAHGNPRKPGNVAPQDLWSVAAMTPGWTVTPHGNINLLNLWQ